jgi:hypothetical protein
MIMDFSFENIYKFPAFVAHLESLTERKPFFMKNLTEAGFKNIRIFPGVNGLDKNEIANTIKELELPNFDTFSFRYKKYGPGSSLNGFKILKHIIDNNISVSVLFDDDVHFHPQWKELSEQYWNETPKDFDILFMGNGLDSCREIGRAHV